MPKTECVVHLKTSICIVNEVSWGIDSKSGSEKNRADFREFLQARYRKQCNATFPTTTVPTTTSTTTSLVYP